MSILIPQSDAAEMFDLPTVVLYVCDGKIPSCAKPECADLADRNACHHTRFEDHALYDTHDVDKFERYSAIRDDEAAIICVEPVRE